MTVPDTVVQRSSFSWAATWAGTCTARALLRVSSRSRASSWLFHLMVSTPPELDSSSCSPSSSSPEERSVT